MIEKIKQWAKSIYHQLSGIDDSPQKVAIAFGLGVFLGILPGPGPIAALGLAWLLRLNKAAALLGSVLTNAWLSVVTFPLALKIGASLTGVRWQDIQEKAKDLFVHFSWQAFWDVSLTQILKPLLLGYTVVGFCCGLLGYVGILIFFACRRRR